jgi:hypothetical protein
LAITSTTVTRDAGWGAFRHIALHPADMVADQFHGGIEFSLTPASDEDIWAFCDESLCGG